jgi:phosphopantetheinyl transferase
MAPARALEFLRGRYALKLLAQQHVPLPMSELLVAADTFGKPEIQNRPDLFCSISGSGVYAAAAISHKRAVGIDVELIKVRHPAFLRQIATQEEAEGLAGRYTGEVIATLLWTCKEAAAKADARIHSLDRYEVHMGQHLWVSRSVRVWDIEVVHMSPYIAALAVERVL